MMEKSFVFLCYGLTFCRKNYMLFATGVNRHEIAIH